MDTESISLSILLKNQVQNREWWQGTLERRVTVCSMGESCVDTLTTSIKD